MDWAPPQMCTMLCFTYVQMWLGSLHVGPVEEEPFVWRQAGDKAVTLCPCFVFLGAGVAWKVSLCPGYSFLLSVCSGVLGLL